MQRALYKSSCSEARADAATCPTDHSIRARNAVDKQSGSSKLLKMAILDGSLEYK
jgi:hypothetical protein